MLSPHCADFPIIVKKKLLVYQLLVYTFFLYNRKPGSTWEVFDSG